MQSQIFEPVTRHEARKHRKSYAELQAIKETIEEETVEMLDAIGNEGEQIDELLAEIDPTPEFCHVCRGAGFYWMDEDAPRAICPCREVN